MLEAEEDEELAVSDGAATLWLGLILAAVGRDLLPAARACLSETSAFKAADVFTSTRGIERPRAGDWFVEAFAAARSAVLTKKLAGCLGSAGCAAMAAMAMLVIKAVVAPFCP